MTRSSLEVRTVVIGGEEYSKPYDPGCACCRSPWHLQIDEMLSEGYGYPAIQKMLRGRKPAPPRPEHIGAHVEHLAEPHRKMREQLEESARERGDGGGLSLLKLPDVLGAVVQRGFAAMAAGELEITSRDLLRALALQADLDRVAKAGSTISSESWHAAFVEMLSLVRKHMDAVQWASFSAEVYASPQIRAIEAQSPAPSGA